MNDYMDMDIKDKAAYWQELRRKMKTFAELDDAEVVFGARTRGAGHAYGVLPKVTDAEIKTFEENNGFGLPDAYRIFLQEFGAGGAGPNYGVADYRTYVMPYAFQTPFPYDEETWFDDVGDDDPIWDAPGLVWLSDLGCGAGYRLELNGRSPGRMWCDWAQACSPSGSFQVWYGNWARRVETGLERYHLIRSFIDGETLRLVPTGLRLDDVVGKLQCGYKTRGAEWSSSVAEGERWVYFEDTPARVVIDDNDIVLRIDVFRSNAIT